MLPVHSALNWPLECFESSSWHEITLTSLPLTAPAGPRKLIDFENRNSKSICEWPLSTSITESESILTIKSYVPVWKLLLYHIVMPTFFYNSLYIISKWCNMCRSWKQALLYQIMNVFVISFPYAQRPVRIMQLPTGDNVAASECNKAVCYPSTSQQPANTRPVTGTG